MPLMPPHLHIQAREEDLRPLSPIFTSADKPLDGAVFWRTLDDKGWGADHDLNSASQEGYTFLSFVLFYCPQLLGSALAMVQEHPQAADLINRRDPFGHHEGWTPLHWAARLFQGHTWIPSLLQLGADPKMGCQPEENSHAALGLLMLSFNPRMQQFFQKDLAASCTATHALIDAGSDLRQMNDEQSTPLHAAAAFAPHLVPLLLSGPDAQTIVNAVDSFSTTALVRSLIHHPEVSGLLLDAGADPWLSLDRPDGAFIHAADLVHKLISGRLDSPHLFSAQALWKELAQRMECHKHRQELQQSTQDCWTNKNPDTQENSKI